MIANRRFTPFFLALALSTSLYVGCNSGTNYEHASVHGKVTYQGKPLTFGQVLFVPVQPPEDGSMQPASGLIQSDGTYQLKSEATGGAILGEHKVIVIAVQGDKPDDSPKPAPTESDAPTPSKTNFAVQFKSAIPKKYSDPQETPLVRKVNPGDNTIDIEITD